MTTYNNLYLLIKLKRAFVTNTDTGKEFKADYRISQR